ncbi:MAG: hypothetical protein R3E96_11080 [Planctomycetota bacterium]
MLLCVAFDGEGHNQKSRGLAFFVALVLRLSAAWPAAANVSLYNSTLPEGVPRWVFGLGPRCTGSWAEQARKLFVAETHGCVRALDPARGVAIPHRRVGRG